MSQGGQEVSTELVQILRATLSDRADVRREAENAFLSSWVPRPSELFPQLVTVLLGAGQYTPEEQSLAAVFFRRWINRETSNGSELVAWTELSSELQNSCKAALLESFRRSNDRTVRNRISDAISQVATLVSQYEEWQELMEFLVVSLSSSSETDDSINALLRIISASPDLFSNQEAPALSSLVSVLNGAVSSRPGVAVESAQALSNLTIFFYPDEKRRAVFASVVTQIIPSIAQMLSANIDNKEDELAQVLNHCASLVFECPKLFVGKKSEKHSALQDYISMASTLIRRLCEDQYDEEDAVASAALELICAAVEGNPSAFRRDRALLEASAILLLQVAGMESSTNDWLSTDPTDEDDLLSMSVLGQQSLDRFALALGGAVAGPILFNHIGSLLTGPASSSSWRSKYSALMAIASTAEGCAQDFLEDHLEGLLAILWPCFNGAEHARVQYAACHALGQLCTDFPGRIQEEFARDALSALLSLLQNSTEARVQCHASAALVNFAENCDPETVAPFLDDILSILARILGANCPVYLKEQLIATIGAYSGAAQSRFAGFFDQLLPLLVAGLDGSQARKVQCRAVEALSLVLLAVKGVASIQTSLNNCIPGFLQHLKSLEESLHTAPADDPMREFLSEAWLRMARLMGPDFAACLPIILPGLINCAGSEIKMVELPENDEEENENFIPAARVNGRNVGINTSSLSEKAAALESLAALISAVGPGAFPEAERVFTISTGLVNFEWSGDVRSAAVEASTASLECLGYPDGACEALISAIIQGLTEMYETDFACSALDALSILFNTCAKTRSLPCLASILPRLNEILQSLLELTCDNIRQIQADQAEDDEEEEETDEGEGFLDTAEDEEVLYAWGRLQAAIFECFPQALDLHNWAITFASVQLKVIAQKSSKNTSKQRSKKTSPVAAASSSSVPLDNEALQHVCLGVLCDAMQWLKTEGAFAFGQDFVDSCLTALSAPDAAVSPLVRQVAAHLAGQMAAFAPTAFKDFCIQAVTPLLEKLIKKREARAPSQVSVTDNAVSALIRIHSAFPGSLAPDTSTFIGQFLLPGLPVISDDAEINGVATFLMQNFNPQAVWAPTVLSALVTVKTTPSASIHLKSEIAEALQPFLREQLAQSQAKDRILSALTAEQISRL